MQISHDGFVCQKTEISSYHYPSGQGRWGQPEGGVGRISHRRVKEEQAGLVRRRSSH